MSLRSTANSKVVQQISVTLTAAEIIAAETIPHILIPAVPNKTVAPLMLSYKYSAGSPSLTAAVCYVWQINDSSYAIFSSSWAYPSAGTDGSETFSPDFSSATPGIGESIKFQPNTVVAGDENASLTITIAYVVL